MKKVPLLITLAAIVLCCFASSCAKQNDYDGYVETTGKRFGTVDEQVAYLQGLLSTLSAEKVVLAGYADFLKQTGDDRAEEIDLLLAELGVKMSVVEDSLGTYASKSWADATFATLELVDSLSGVAAKLAVKVREDSTAIAKNIDESIDDSEKELKKKFESYYTKSEVDGMMLTLKGRLHSLDSIVDVRKDSVKVLEAEVVILQSGHTTLSAKLDSAVNALKKADTGLMPKITAIDTKYKDSFDSLGTAVAANSAAIKALTGRIGKLEARVRSVEVVPDYIDGGVCVTNGPTPVRFEVRPASAAKALVEKGTKVFTLQAMKVKEATKASIYTAIPVQSAAIDADDSLLVLTVDGAKMPADFFAETQSYSARLSINDGNTVKSTPYFPLIELHYPEAPDQPCIKIADIWWAPVNCGYHSTDYRYGKLYQWGRVSPCEYSASWDDGGGSHTAETQLQATTQGPVAAAEESDTAFYKNSSSPYDWLSPQDSARWNSNLQWPGKETAPAKTEYDPCPEGWRVPTETELASLLGSHTSGELQDGTGVHSGMKGKWFDGSTVSEPSSGLFLSAAGNRRSNNGNAGFRGSLGCYWSSSVFGSNARHLNFNSNSALMNTSRNANGFSVRCVME